MICIITRTYIHIQMYTRIHMPNQGQRKIYDGLKSRQLCNLRDERPLDKSCSEWTSEIFPDLVTGRPY